MAEASVSPSNGFSTMAALRDFALSRMALPGFVVIRIVGRSAPLARSLAKASRPLIPCRTWSSTRQALPVGRGRFRSASPLAKPMTRKLSNRKANDNAERRASSSSTMIAVGRSSTHMRGDGREVADRSRRANRRQSLGKRPPRRRVAVHADTSNSMGSSLPASKATTLMIVKIAATHGGGRLRRICAIAM